MSGKQFSAAISGPLFVLLIGMIIGAGMVAALG